MSFSDIDVVHPADAPSSRRKLLCTLWCLLVSQTSLCSLLCRLSSLSVWLLIIQRQTDLRSSAAAAKEKQERWRSSIRATGRTHEIRGQLLGGSLEEKDCTSEFFFFLLLLLSLLHHHTLALHFQFRQDFDWAFKVCENVGMVDHGI